MRQVRAKVNKKALDSTPSGISRYGRWFRLYAETLHDPKVLRLNDRQFRAWIGMLCMAADNSGSIPDSWSVACHLRMQPQDADDIITDLIEARLVDIMPDGTMRPHSWDKRQFVSDVSTNRVRKHREKRQRSGDETFQKPFRSDFASESVSVTTVELGDGEYPSQEKNVNSLGGDGNGADAPVFVGGGRQ